MGGKERGGEQRERKERSEEKEGREGTEREILPIAHQLPLCIKNAMSSAAYLLCN